MSASLLSGGSAPSSVVPTGGEGGTIVQGLAIQQTQGVLPTSVDVLTNCVWAESPYPQLADPAVPGQATYQLGVQNGNGNGWNEGHLQLFGLSGATPDNMLLDIPKQSPVANAGTRCVQLVGADQSGQVTIALGGTQAPVVTNARVTAASIIMVSLASGAATQAGSYAATAAAGSFQVTSTVIVAGAPAVLNYFIVKY